MPELPEVETISNRLRLGGPDSPPVVGLTIESAWLLWERTLAEPTPAEFNPRIVGQTIEDVGRRGKFLLFHLTRDTLLIHLRMSGDIHVLPAAAPPAPHDRLVLFFESAHAHAPIRMAFNDTRKFGRAWLVDDPQTVLGSLGPEPLSPAFTAEDLYERLQSAHRQIKPLLLDQTFLAGLGNIYADESLYRAQIHPLTASNSLTYEQAERLWESIRAVLNEGIRRQGASIDWVYRGGDFQNYFNVYQRTGEPCPRCGTPVVRLLVGQRGTHICPNCQNLPGR